MLNIIKAVCVIIGTIIGAGFASGREIYIFFNIHGIKGILGIILASMITGLTIYKVLKHLSGRNVENYNAYIESLGINTKIKEVINSIINIFLLISFYIMVAGFCAYFKQEFELPLYLSGLIMAGICYFTFISNIEGVAKINTMLIPILILIIILIGIENGFGGVEEIVEKSQQNVIYEKGNWLISSIEYASYNSILLIPMLIGLRKYSYRNERKISIISTVVFFILSLILYHILLSGGTRINEVELPLIYIVNQYGSVYKYICGIVIVSAIYTSAISAGYGFIQNCTKTKRSYKALAAFICISSMFVIKIGFSKLVDLLYPVFGLLSLIQLFFIFKKQTIEKKDKN